MFDRRTFTLTFKELVELPRPQLPEWLPRRLRLFIYGEFIKGHIIRSLQKAGFDLCRPVQWHDDPMIPGYIYSQEVPPSCPTEKPSA